jgi:hypothetical protein
MNLKQRAARYLLGLGIGCILVFIMFPSYNWLGWTPNNTLMKQIRESEFVISERGNCYMHCTMTNLEQVQAMRNSGKIDFNKSDAQANPKKYHVQYGEVGMDVLVTDSLITLDKIEAALTNTCICR